jgi:hypothetical protein
MLNNVKHGYGEYSFANGDIYKGLFQLDLRSGRGNYVWSDSSSYKG